MTAPPWHEGERALQQRAGVAERMAEVGRRVVRDHMPDQHRGFFAELPLLFTGRLDARGQPWASVLAGPPGFADSPTPRLLRVAAHPLAHDAVGAQWSEGAPIALLGLQAETGRRNRMNGRIAAAGEEGIAVAVGQSFGNCPKYIHPRRAVYTGEAGQPRVRRSLRLDEDDLRLVRTADTLFIASAHPGARDAVDPVAGVDVSHRGGATGFVQTDGQGRLLVPDYVGNTFFNTLGNLQLEPRCGLLFIDFAAGTRLHLACRATLLDAPPDDARWPGALRLLRLQVLEVVRLEGGLPLRWLA